MFARGLNYESKNIDVLSYEPGEIQQDKNFIEKITWTTSAKKSVRVCLADLGLTSYSNGPIMQDMNLKLACSLPTRFIQIILYSASLNNIARLRAKE